MRKPALLPIFIFIFVAVVLAVGIRLVKSGGATYRQVVTVKDGEYVTIQLGVSHSVYFFGYRLPVTFTERRKVDGVTLHDYQSGKLIGRYHDIGVAICPHCHGVGEVKNAD